MLLGFISNFAFGSEIQFQEQSFPLNSESNNSILEGKGRSRCLGDRREYKALILILLLCRSSVLGQETCQLVILWAETSASSSWDSMSKPVPGLIKGLLLAAVSWFSGFVFSTIEIEH